jgi:heptosyltransferase-3
LKIPKKILIIIQRSNGDVLLSSSLIKSIYEEYDAPKIDLLINDDTNAIAKLIPFIHDIHFFSYMQKQHNRWSQEKKIISKIFKKYDLSISLTASDRSVFYGIVSAKKSISAVEIKHHKSWWKKIFLTHYYYFDNSKHLLLNNLQSLQFLNINVHNIHHEIGVSSETIFNIKEKLKVLKITNFFIFHPSAQYSYKVYPQKLRDILLSSLSKLDIPILITGGKGSIDNGIKKQLPSLNNVFDFIGETSLEEFFALSKLSLGYIGMDTLNMHIAASQNKRVFAIFGPTNLKMWSPWSNQLKLSATKDQPKQTYGNITVFQANMPCVACGKAGCDNNHGNSDCLDNIDPATISKEVESWIKSRRDYISIPIPIPIPIEMEYSQRKVLLYIVYGDDQTYYDGAIFSFLTFKNWILEDDQIEVVVLTEKPEKFSSYSIKLLTMSEEQKHEWSLGGKYHFRIKNRGLAFVMDHLKLKDFDKILFLDTDTYFHKSPLPLFDLIQPDQALFYLNEGLIYDKKRFYTYVENLEGKKIQVDDEFYELSKKSALWGSLMVGITTNMRPSLDWADKLMVKLFYIVPSHTIEPFALSESLLRRYKMIEGKNYVKLYSTSRKKEYARKILSNFFKENNLLQVDEQIRLAQNVKVSRPLFVILKQRFLHIFKK